MYALFRNTAPAGALRSVSYVNEFEFNIYASTSVKCLDFSYIFQDILENEDIKLDNMFIASLVGDIIRVINSSELSLLLLTTSIITKKNIKMRSAD